MFTVRKSHQQRVVAMADGNEGGRRERWDVGRFVKTLWFFNKPPTPNQLLQNMFGKKGEEAETHSGAMIRLLDGKKQHDDIVMVTGATGGVGRRVVDLMLKKGRHVRAMVRDVEKAKDMYAPVVEELKKKGDMCDATLELVPVDIAQKKTLLPEYFVNVRQLVWCSATKIVPKEGDTPDRKKYYQGIKFYDPEVQGDTPEAVEYHGMQHVLSFLKSALPVVEGMDIFNPSHGKSMVFGPIDDVVMGGVSSSMLSISPLGSENGESVGIFAGRVTSANNGGFASVRSRNFSPALDVSAYDGFELRVKGDGQRYKFIARTEEAFDGVGYTCSFDTKPGVWQTVRIPFEKLIPVFRARVVSDGKPLNRKHISSLQLMLSKFEYDGKLNPSWKEGPFELPIESIKAYVETKNSPQVVMVSSAGVTRPNRPGIDVEQEPPAVKMNDALGGLLTYKLKSEDVLRESGIPYAIVRPVALTEEPAGAEVVLDQGDTIKGKISRDDVAELCIALLEQPEAVGLTFEIKSTVPFSTPYESDPNAPPRDWGEVLRSSALKPGVTGKTINGVYTGKEVERNVVHA